MQISLSWKDDIWKAINKGQPHMYAHHVASRFASHRLQSEVFYRMVNEKLSILISPTPDKTLLVLVPHREVF